MTLSTVLIADSAITDSAIKSEQFGGLFTPLATAIIRRFKKMAKQ